MSGNEESSPVVALQPELLANGDFREAEEQLNGHQNGFLQDGNDEADEKMGNFKDQCNAQQATISEAKDQELSEELEQTQNSVLAEEYKTQDQVPTDQQQMIASISAPPFTPPPYNQFVPIEPQVQQQPLPYVQHTGYYNGGYSPYFPPHPHGYYPPYAQPQNINRSYPKAYSNCGPKFRSEDFTKNRKFQDKRNNERNNYQQKDTQQTAEESNEPNEDNSNKQQSNIQTGQKMKLGAEPYNNQRQQYNGGYRSRGRGRGRGRARLNRDNNRGGQYYSNHTNNNNNSYGYSNGMDYMQDGQNYYGMGHGPFPYAGPYAPPYMGYPPGMMGGYPMQQHPYPPHMYPMMDQQMMHQMGNGHVHEMENGFKDMQLNNRDQQYDDSDDRVVVVIGGNVTNASNSVEAGVGVGVEKVEEDKKKVEGDKIEGEAKDEGDEAEEGEEDDEEDPNQKPKPHFVPGLDPEEVELTRAQGAKLSKSAAKRLRKKLRDQSSASKD